MRLFITAGLLLAAVTFWWQQPAAVVLQQDPATLAANAGTSMSGSAGSSAAVAGSNNGEAQMGEEERQRVQSEQRARELQQLLNDAATTGQGNAQRWLEALWRECMAAGADDCAALQAALAEYLTPEQQQWLQTALENFTDYHRDMSQLTLSTEWTPQQRYEAVHTLRQQHFGEQTAALFGREDAFANYQFQYDYLRSVEAQHLSVEQRLQALAQLQQGLQLGEDRADLLGPDAQYRQAVELLQDLPLQQQEQWRQQLREQYFGEQAAEVAAYEERREQQQLQQQTYQQELQALQQHWQQNGGLNSPGYQQELQALRQRVFAAP